MTYLAVSISPVQSYIQASRKIRDLKASSQILSHLMGELRQELVKKGWEIVIPALTQAGAPNRLLGQKEVPSGHESETGEQTIRDLRTCWMTSLHALAANSVRRTGVDQEIVKTERVLFVTKQVRSPNPEFERMVVAIGASLDRYFELFLAYSQDHGGIAQELLRAKLSRPWKLPPPLPGSGPKTICPLCGEAYADQDLKWSDGPETKPEALCGVCFTKRKYRDEAGVTTENVANRGDLKTPYLALLTFDGDGVGEALSTSDDPRVLSASLGLCAVEALKMTKAYQGEFVYSGGDDYLGLFPLDRVLPALDEMDKVFHTQTGLTLSAGVLIFHHKSPLNSALVQIRQLVGQAKRQGKNRVCLGVQKHSGELQQLTLPLSIGDDRQLPVFLRLLESVKKDAILPRSVVHTLGRMMRNDLVNPTTESFLHGKFLQALYYHSFNHADHGNRPQSEVQSAAGQWRDLLVAWGMGSSANFLQGLQVIDFLTQWGDDA